VLVQKKEGVTLAQLSAPAISLARCRCSTQSRDRPTVTAIGEVEVLVLQRDRFHSLVQQRPGVLMQLFTTLVRRLRLAEQVIPALSRRP
jgi:CRP-like cAMP-binding protein